MTTPTTPKNPAMKNTLSAKEQSLLGTHDHPEHPGQPDWRITIEPAPVIGLVTRTNGDPVHQEGNEEVWENLMETYELAKNPAAQALGASGGHARASKLSPERRIEIARAGGKARAKNRKSTKR